MSKKIRYILPLLAFLPISSCSVTATEKETIVNYVQNGGFESADLSGWSVEYGDAYSDDSVSSRSDFYFKDDAKYNQIKNNKTGNWYLSGQGFDLKYSFGRVGAIRSSNFFLTEDGMISFKLAGGALTKGKGTNAENKNIQEACYLGVYLASNDKMIARQTNEYFLEHTEDFVDVSKYDNGVYHTDNFCEYSLDLSEYKNQECYIRIVDNDRDPYYGYLSVDDIRIGDELAQEEGKYFVKSRNYVTEVEAKDEYHIKNPDFEIGSLGGWDIVEGDAFSHEGVNYESTWWNENITYNRDGNYHYGYYNPSGTGVLRSSVFKLGGEGYISFKLGGCSNQDLTYIRFMALKGGEPIEVARVSNVQYKNEQFPFVPMKMHLLNMLQYYIDLHEYVGEALYIEIVDNNSSSDDLGCMTFDSFETYYEEKPYWSNNNYYFIDVSTSIEFEPDNEYQVKNGTFETGDLSNWSTSWSDESNRMGEISSKSYWWNSSSLPFNKKGTYFFSGEENEGNTGTITSSSFKVGGSGFVSFRMSGGKNPKLCYVSIIDANSNEELLRFSNFMFNDLGTSLIGQGSHLMDMILYKADLTSLMGREVKIQVVDNATSDWGLICVDSFITYYENKDLIDKEAILNPNVLSYAETESIYQVKNGTFETGDMSNWTASDPANPIMNISRDYTWWNECYLFNKAGSYFLNGWSSGESNTGTLTSSTFKLGGSGFVSYKLGGGKNKELCYIEFIDASTNEVLAKTYNQKFKEMGKSYYYLGEPRDLAKDDVYLANMVDYKLDLSNYIGRDIYIRISDNATSDWGLMFVDNFITYHESSETLSNFVAAETF